MGIGDKRNHHNYEFRCLCWFAKVTGNADKIPGTFVKCIGNAGKIPGTFVKCIGDADKIPRIFVK